MPTQLRIAVRVFERLAQGRELLWQERRDLHFTVDAKHHGKAKRAAREVFEERHPTLLWLGAAYTSQQELRATVSLRPPPKKDRGPVYLPGTGAQYTSAGRRR